MAIIKIKMKVINYKNLKVNNQKLMLFKKLGWIKTEERKQLQDRKPTPLELKNMRKSFKK